MLPDDDKLLQRLATLVVKDRVSLGGLSASQQALTLALAWAGLPADAVLSEPEVNAELKAQLAGAVVWLATDHVELRRWLVDAGWLQRDGYGREYRRVAWAGLRPEQQPLATALSAIDPAGWTAARRAAHGQARDARRRLWAGSGTPDRRGAGA